MSLARVVPLLLPFALIGCGDGQTVPSQTPKPAAAAREDTRKLVEIPVGAGTLAAMARRRGLTLRARPAGRVIAHLSPRTDWGSPTVVWAVERRGNWLGVVTTALRNNQVGWLDVQHDRPRMWRAHYSLRADLSRGTLELRRNGRLVRRIPIGTGAAATPTPTGRFTVTDKLIPAPKQSFYGCCLIALSGHQSKLRPGWAGGDRIAIHGGASGRVSAGCLHAPDKDLRHLMKVLPVGTPVTIDA